MQNERLVVYLISSLGNCFVPAGLPLIKEMAARDWGETPATGSLRRQIATWALANLAESTKQLDKLNATNRAEILAALDDEASAKEIDHAARARQCADYLRRRWAGTPEALGVDQVLAECARASDPFLRKVTALALGLWEGTAEENQRMESTLLSLTFDDGHGAGDEAKVRGMEIRYMAAQGLARRGSNKVAGRLGVLAEMLDEDELRRSFAQNSDAKAIKVDEDAVVTTVTNGLRATAELTKKRSDLDLSSLHTAIVRLTHSANPLIRTQAEKTLLVFSPSHS
jgi:hypothetical protein